MTRTYDVVKGGTVLGVALAFGEASQLAKANPGASLKPAAAGNSVTAPEPVKTERLLPLRVISGGQTGADMGGLLAARDLGLETGGCAPLGWKTDAGPQEALLRSFGMFEGAEPGYPFRTRANIYVADITIAFRWHKSPGTDKTIDYCRGGTWDGMRLTEKKPVLMVTTHDEAQAVEQIAGFIEALQPDTINVAGHRESTTPGIEAFVRTVMREALRRVAAADEATPAIAPFVEEDVAQVEPWKSQAPFEA